jgi:hypothetical protein
MYEILSQDNRIDKYLQFDTKFVKFEHKIKKLLLI